MSAETEQRKLAAIMFTDMVGYSAIARRNEALALELLVNNNACCDRFYPNTRDAKSNRPGTDFWSSLPAPWPP